MEHILYGVPQSGLLFGPFAEVQGYTEGLFLVLASPFLRLFLQAALNTTSQASKITNTLSRFCPIVCDGTYL